MRKKSLSHWHALAVAWLGCLFDGLDASIFTIVLYPALSELLGTKSYSIVGYYGAIIIAFFLVGWALGGLVFGRLADQVGRVKTLIISILVYTIATGLCAISQSWQELAIYRFLVGLGIGGELSVGAIMLSEHWHGRQRLHAVSFMATSWGVGYFATAAISLGLCQASWRNLFAAGVIPALITLYIRLRLSESEKFVALQNYRASLRAENNLKDEQRKVFAEPLKETFKKEMLRPLLVIVAITSSGIIGYWTVLSWIPAWINQLTGTAATYERSVALMVMNLGSIIGAAATGFIVLRIGRKLTIGLAFGLTLILCQIMFNTIHSFDSQLLILLFFCGLFSIMSAVTICIYVPEVFPLHMQGTAFGLAFNFGRIIAAAFALISGQLIATFNGSYALAASALSYVYVLGILAACLLPTPRGGRLNEIEKHLKNSVGKRPTPKEIVSSSAK
ncbi:MAG: hypothetical protein QG574_1778 [Cyanobacteriota bacterium erpe_2018_sw_21hr_WHONDRS-SW48-000092_B_bin.40]|nr:hypothetical protein [Cyanobacteriota bacterium erpe_2018_sw_21hr_WHONDRS-SW48-000092_B_bin.40]